MDSNKNELIKKILDRLMNRKTEHDKFSKELGEIFSNFKTLNSENSENEKKIKELTPSRPCDEIIDIIHEGIDFKVKIWYDENYEAIFKIAEAELNKIDDYNKLDRIDVILQSLFESDSFKTEGVENLKRLINKFIADENYEEAKKIKLIMEKKEIENTCLEDFKNEVSQTYEEILNENDKFKLSDETIKKFENIFKKIKKNRKK